MTRGRLLAGVVALLLVALGLWLASATEWVEVEVPVRPRGEAAQNPLYATQALARALGAQVFKAQGLQTLPASTATLVLASHHWDVFNDKSERLQDWVQQGGHLVVPAWLMDDENLSDWLPVTQREARDEKASSKPDRRDRTEKDSDCRSLIQATAVPDSDLDPLRVCGWEHPTALQGDGTPSWALEGTRGPELMRMAWGQGSVTVIGAWGLLSNPLLLRHDNALAVAWALQLRAGADVWFVAEESREALHTWLWHKAWVALLLGLLALGFALWRGGMRLGALRNAYSTERRSMAEQVRGTGQFLQLHGPAALYRAQLRAVNDAGLRSVRQYTSLTVAERAKALAAATGLNPSDLATAMDASQAFKAHSLLPHLQLLETARRRLAERGRH